LKEAACQSYRIWAAVGKPRMGKEFDNMRQDKRRYKTAIKTKESNSSEQFSDSLNDALLCKDVNSFWNTWRVKFSKSTNSAVIDINVKNLTV